MTWRALAAVLSLSAMLVAGCADPGEPSAGPGSGGDDAGAASDNNTASARPLSDAQAKPKENRSEQRLVQSFDLVLTEVHLLGRNGFGSNCVHVQGAPFEITRLNLTVTWTPSGPFDSELELAVVQLFGEYDERVSGPSPLSFSAVNLPPAHEGVGGQPDERYLLAVQMSQQGAIRDVPARLDVDMTYLADHPLDVGLSGCALG